MKNKPLLIVLGEPNSIFSELLFKVYKKKIIQTFNKPILVIGSEKLIKSQMKLLNYSIKIKKHRSDNIKNIKINNNFINIIDVNYNFNKVFDKITKSSKLYINNCFKLALNLLKKNLASSLINGPVSKEHFLERKYLGVTEYLAKNTNIKKKPTMLIYNPSFSVCPVTTHVPILKVSKHLTKNKIINDVKNINNFFKKYLKKKPNFAILGLNPHCESIEKKNEEESIIKPAIKLLIKKKIKVKGPFSADTFFLKKNLSYFDVAVGMYHDQVLTPMKTIYGFDAINLSLGLPFLRASPDHGTNNAMVGKNISDPKSLVSLINFFKKLNANKKS